MSKRFLALLVPFLIIFSSSKIVQLNEKKWESIFSSKEYDQVLVYFYSSSCPYCQQFNPIYEKIDQQINSQMKGKIILTKLDGNAYKKISSRYQIYSYPTIALFWNQIQIPIYHYGPRGQSQIINFIKQSIKYKLPVLKPQYQLEKEFINSAIIYKGSLNALQYNQSIVLQLRDKYKPIFHHQCQNCSSNLLFYGTQYIYSEHSLDFYQDQHLKIKAKVYQLDQQPWLKIHYNKIQAIVFVNPSQNEQLVKDILTPLALKYYRLVFLNLKPNHSQYKNALKHFQIPNKQQFIGIDEAAKAKFVMTPQQAAKPYKTQKIQQFIKGVINRTQTVYRKSQSQVNDPHKLTRQEKFDNSKNYDIILFLYSTQNQQSQKVAKKVLQLFKYLLEVKKLNTNPKLFFLRCDVYKNQIQQKLGFVVGEWKSLPKIIYYRHKMKQNPIHFNNALVNDKQVMEFIMQNTTHDWEGYQL